LPGPISGRFPNHVMRFPRSPALLFSLLPCVLHASEQPSEKRTQQLKSLTLEQLGNIEVTTQSKEPTQVWDTPAAIYVVTGDDIRRSGATSISDALRLVPGVNVARVNGSRDWAVGIRGFGDQFSKYVLVLIDGRSVYSPRYGSVWWNINYVMLEDIDRIEVIRGPGGTIWGAHAVNGVINIITKHSQQTRGTLISAGGGNVDQNTEDLRYISEPSDWTWRASVFRFVRSPEYHIGGQPHYDWSRDGDRFSCRSCHKL
jgi:iron complex outermembrane recepter protein